MQWLPYPTFPPPPLSTTRLNPVVASWCLTPATKDLTLRSSTQLPRPRLRVVIAAVQNGLGSGLKRLERSSTAPRAGAFHLTPLTVAPANSRASALGILSSQHRKIVGSTRSAKHSFAGDHFVSWHCPVTICHVAYASLFCFATPAQSSRRSCYVSVVVQVMLLVVTPKPTNPGPRYGANRTHKRITRICTLHLVSHTTIPDKNSVSLLLKVMTPGLASSLTGHSSSLVNVSVSHDGSDATISMAGPGP
jgi:hypothetical protein